MFASVLCPVCGLLKNKLIFDLRTAMKFFKNNFRNSIISMVRGGASLFCLVLLLTNCTKREDAGIGNIADPQFEGPPPSIPTLTMNSPSYYDQFSRLSIGLASMFGDTAVCNGADLLDNLTDLVNTQQNRPAHGSLVCKSEQQWVSVQIAHDECRPL
jgi:hypothetical protein